MVEITLTSWPKYESLANNILLHKQVLTELLEMNDQKLVELAKTYNERVLEGKNVDVISKSMRTIKADSAAAKHELEVIYSSENLLGDYSKAVYDEYKGLQKDVLAEFNRLYSESENILDEAMERVLALKVEADNLIQEFAAVTHAQLIPAVNDLPMNDSVKDGIKWNAGNIIASTHTWPTF